MRRTLRELPTALKFSLAQGILLFALVLGAALWASSHLKQWLEEEALRDLQRTNRLVVSMLGSYDRSLRQEVERNGRIFASLFGKQLEPSAVGLSHPGQAARRETLVSEFAADSGAVASILVRDGDDFAVSASSLKQPDGTVDTGGLLTQSASFEVLRGKDYIDKVTVAGKEYMAHYAPVRSATGEVVGALAVGLDLTAALRSLKDNILSVKIGETGYVYALDGRDKEGELMIHPAIEGANMLHAMDGGGRQFVREMLERGSGVIRYDWANPGEAERRAKIVVYERFPAWDWVIASSSYLDEFTREADIVMRNNLLTASGGGLVILLLFALLASTSRDNQKLEGEVAERSAVLARTNAELADSAQRLGVVNRDLETAKRQLLQAEKMSSLGQLAAGIAHEINNPVGFISSNLNTLQKQVGDLLRIIDAYGRADGALTDERLVAAIERAKKEADLDFLRDDIAALVGESQDGIQRVRKIVRDLKDFSRVDQAEWAPANLEEGIDSTLNIVWNELKYKAEVVKEYAGIAEVECIASQLNQVFMNLLVNAAHAIETHGTITIRTGCDEKNAWVEIADTGKGIPPENLRRIFDPFFTTKPAGQGTGLGLSITAGIVERHRGTLDVESTVGRGTRFRVTLPRQRAKEGAGAGRRLAATAG